MTTVEKAALVESVQPGFGLPPALRVLGLSRSTWYYHRAHGRTYAEKHAPLKRVLETIAREHPEYGYRRATPELSDRLGRTVNPKVVQNLNRLWDLRLLRGVKLPRPSVVRNVIIQIGDRANLVAALDDIDVLEVLYTDFTELLLGREKAYLIPFVDHRSKMVLGWALGERAVTGLALEAWCQARKTLARLGRSPRGVIVHHDQDPVFTGYGWTGRLLLKDQARISYALDGAKDNPEMESFFGRFKTENGSLLQEARTVKELEAVIVGRIRYYNRVRRHSSLENQAPWNWLRKRIRSRRSQ